MQKNCFNKVLLFFFPVFVLSIVIAMSCLALSPAGKTLETTVNRIMECIKNPNYTNPATREPLRKQIEQEVRLRFDFMEFSLRTVGARWNQFTPEQKKDFSQAFSDLLISTYVKKINGYNGESVAYIGERLAKSMDKAEIQTVLTMKDGKTTPVDYRMLLKDGTWKIYDVLVEKISLVKNYRTQFQDILKNGGVDQLIARVKSKAEESKTDVVK